MANKNIKGITIEIGGDTTGLDKALRGVNKGAKDAQAELREVNQALKLDPSSTELLEQKQRALAEAVEKTSEKLKILETAQKQAQDQLERGEISQQQYDALTREISRTEAELRKAKAAADNFSVSLEQAKVAADKVAGAAQAVADKTKALSGIAAGVATAIGGMAYKAVTSADDLNTLSKQTGISTDQLQKMAYASDLVDVSVDDIAGAMSKLRKSMGSTSKEVQGTFEALGVSVTDANGNYRDSTEVFYEALEALSQVENETQRDLYAMDLFGRGADRLAGIVDDGGASLKALGKEAEDLGVILDQDTLDSLNAINDQLDKLKAKAAGEIAVTGAKAAEALSPVLDKVIDKISALLDWIGQLDEGQIQTILTVAAVIAAISPVAGIIAGIASAVSSVLTLLPQLKAAGAAINAFAAANPILLIAAAVAAVAAVIYTHWDKIKPILEQAWEKAKAVGDNIKGKLQEVADKVTGAFERIRDTVKAIWEGITGTIKDKINAIIGHINNLIDKINGLTAKISENKIVSGIAGVFGMKLGGLERIPLLAGGGSVSSGSAIVGEAGPEILTMQSGRANVQPVANTTNTYNTINNTSRQPIQLQINLDGVRVARQLYDPMQQVAREHGPALVEY